MAVPADEHLRLYRAHRGRLTIEPARAILRAGFRSQGLAEDRYGNFSAGRNERWHFSAQMLQRQEMYDGAWRPLSSNPTVEAALAMLADAATSAGDEATASRARSELNARASGKDTRAAARKKQAGESAMTDAARAAAFHRVAADHRAEVTRAMGRGRPLAEGRAAELRAELAGHFEAYVRDGAPDESTFGDADAPPLMPLLREGSSLRWVEQLGASSFTVSVRWAADGVAEVEIGSGGGMSLSAVTRAARWSGGGAVGDAYLSGRVTIARDGKMSAAVFALVSRRALAGTQALSIWRRMMAGYGIPRWLGEGMSADGTRMLAILERMGRLRVVAREGSTVVVENGPPDSRPNPRARKAPRPRSAAPAPLEVDVADAVESAELSYGNDARGRACWFNVVRRSRAVAMSLDAVRRYDDVDAWLGMEPGELVGLDERALRDALARFRGTEWAERALSWRSAGAWKIPTIVVVVGERFTTLGDGRGRYSLATGLGLPEVPVAVVEVECELKSPPRAGRGR